MPRYGYFATEPRSEKMMGVAFVSHHARIQEPTAETVECSGPWCTKTFLKIKYGNNFKKYCCQACNVAADKDRRKANRMAKKLNPMPPATNVGPFNWRIK